MTASDLYCDPVEGRAIKMNAIKQTRVLKELQKYANASFSIPINEGINFRGGRNFKLLSIDAQI